VERPDVKDAGCFTYNAIIPFVERPSRYTYSELNLASGGFESGRFNVLLVFPDTYEIGMSHQGIQFLYQRAARMDGVGVELGFAPWPDMERLMRASGEPYRSKQTATSAKRFDLIGFSMTYELHFTNMLLVLDLAGVALESGDRGEDDPIIVAGGPAATNPLPFVNAVDAVFIGDGEESLVEAIEILKGLKAKGATRAERVRALASIEGVYVDGVSSRVVSRLYRLGRDDFADRVIVPSSGIVHDRLSVEVMRGCTRGCRFCHAGMFYRPTRERSVEEIADAIMKGIESSGWQEVSLMSLSTSDYSRLDELVARISPWLEKRHVSLAMPSLRPETITSRIIEASSLVRKSGFTLAPEAGTERLRRVINKWMTDDVIVEGCERILSAGWKSLKLYFMIGLPTETEEDLEGIVRLVDRILSLPRSSRRFKLSVSISPFVPKPHTPFQWERQCTVDEFLEKEHYLRDRLRGKRIHLSLRDPRFSVLEGIMARGGREMWDVLVDAFHAGCRFDGWSGEMRFELWEEALGKNGLSFEQLLGARNPDEPLPWDFVRLQVAKPFLLRERSRAFEGEITADCRTGPCTGCGADCNRGPGELKTTDGGAERLAEPLTPESSEESLPSGQRLDTLNIKPEAEAPLSAERLESGAQSISAAEGAALGMGTSSGTFQEPRYSAQPVRYRLIFEKMESARFLSHMELLDSIRRALRRAGLPLNYSKGFNPHIRLSAGPSLPVGAEGLREFVDIELERAVQIEPERFDHLLPCGLRIKEIAGPFSRSEGKLSARSRHEYIVSMRELWRMIKGIAESHGRTAGERSKRRAHPGMPGKVEPGGNPLTSDVAEQKWTDGIGADGGMPNLAQEGGEAVGTSRWLGLYEALVGTSSYAEWKPAARANVPEGAEGLIRAYLEIVQREKRAFFEEFLSAMGGDLFKGPALVFGSALRVFIEKKVAFTGARGRERSLEGVKVKRISGDGTIDVTIEITQSSPTIRELVALVMDERLVPIVRITRVSVKYEGPEGFVDPAALPLLRRGGRD